MIIPAGRTVSVGWLTTLQFALASQIALDPHRAAAPNALSALSALKTELVLTTAVWIPVREPAELTPNVRSSVITPSAVVPTDTLEILSCSA